MKEKIAFPQLVDLVAEKAGTSRRMSELFLQEMFSTIGQVLEDGGSVQVKGLGSFKLKDIDGETTVDFIPDKELAEAVNAPFEQFKAVELCDAVTQEKLDEIDAGMQPPAEPAKQPATDVEEAEETGNNPPIEDTKEQPPIEPEQQDVDINSLHSEKPQAPKPSIQALESEASIEQSKPSSRKKWLIVASAIASVALLAGVITLITHHDSGSKNVKTIETDSIASAPTASVTITDTLRIGNRLRDMAQKHYGDQAFWVYIALDNKDAYPDYHEIPNGAVLVIPPAEKYGINSDSKQSLRNASHVASQLRKATKRMKGEPVDEVTPQQTASIQDSESENIAYSSSTTSRHRHHHRHRR